MGLYCQTLPTGDTYAWVAPAYLTAKIPPNYFIECWPEMHLIAVGTDDGGYTTETFREWHAALTWCREDADRRRRGGA